MLNNSFVKQDKLTSFFQEIIASEIKRRIPKNFVEGFNPCNITECDRRIFYKSTGETPIIPEKISLYHVLEKRSQEATKN
jgi:hypothetical protein